MYDVRSKMDEVFLKIKSRNRMTSLAIVRTVAANVVPLPLQKRCNICRLPEATLAHSREPHVQTPEAAKTRQKNEYLTRLPKPCFAVLPQRAGGYGKGLYYDSN